MRVQTTSGTKSSARTVQRMEHGGHRRRRLAAERRFRRARKRAPGGEGQVKRAVVDPRVGLEGIRRELRRCWRPREPAEASSW